MTSMYYKVPRACKKIKSPDGPQEEEKKRHQEKLSSLDSPDNHCSLGMKIVIVTRGVRGVEREMEKRLDIHF